MKSHTRLLTVLDRMDNGEIMEEAAFDKKLSKMVRKLIKKYDIKLPEVYYPPFNFDRTGCKGCPFNIQIQHELDIMDKLLPQERKQCEIIWKPVYDEYRRIGYRLKKDEQMKLF